MHEPASLRWIVQTLLCSQLVNYNIKHYVKFSRRTIAHCRSLGYPSVTTHQQSVIGRSGPTTWHSKGSAITHKIIVSDASHNKGCTTQWPLSCTHFGPPPVTLQRQETKSDTHAVKYTNCLAHHTNMPHVTTHQLATHGSRQG